MSRLIAFWSPSGAGATTLLLNAAAAMGARRPGVAVADLNLMRPSAALAADLLPHDRPLSVCLSRALPVTEGARITESDLNRALLAAPGFDLLAGVLDVVAASHMTAEQVGEIAGVMAGRFPCVLADLPPALDSVACLPLLEMADQVVLVVGPEIGSRFHTRRNLAPMKAMGLNAKFLAVLNRAGAGPAAVTAQQVAQDIDLPVTITVPDVPQVHSFLESGQIAYLAQSQIPALGRFRTAVDGLVTRLLP